MITMRGWNQMAKFEAKRLSKLDWAVVGGAGVSFIALFLPWYGATSGVFSASVSGWSTSYGWFGALLIIAAGVFLALQRSQVNLSSVPVTPALVVMGAAVLGTLIVVIRWITLPSGHAGHRGRHDLQLRPTSRHLLDDSGRTRPGGRRGGAVPRVGRKAPLGPRGPLGLVLATAPAVAARRLNRQGVSADNWLMTAKRFRSRL